jgi:hypothetical protein
VEFLCLEELRDILLVYSLQFPFEIDWNLGRIINREWKFLMSCLPLPPLSVFDMCDVCF